MARQKEEAKQSFSSTAFQLPLADGDDQRTGTGNGLVNPVKPWWAANIIEPVLKIVTKDASAARNDNDGDGQSANQADRGPT